MEKSSVNFPWIDKTYNLLQNHSIPIYIHIYKPTSFRTCKIRQCQLQRIVDNFLSYHRFASSVYEKSRDYLFPVDLWSVFAFVISDTVIKIHTNWGPCSSKAWHCSIDQHCSCPSLTYYCLELCTAIFQCYTSWKFDIEICDTNCQLGVEKKRSQVLSLILNFWGKMCC